MIRHSRCLICDSSTLTSLARFTRVELVACATCGLVFSPCIPSVEELIAHYDGYNRNTSWESPVSVRRREEWLASFEGFRRLNTILDVGCGTGALLNQAKSRGWATFGTEFTESAISICTRSGHNMARGALSAADHQAGSFDVIVYSEVVEHINNHREEFALVAQLLRPGGLLFVTTPNFESVSRRILGDRWNVIQYPEHLAYFTPRTLTRLMNEVGLAKAWMRTTGLSVSRFRASVGSPQPARSAPKQLGSRSADERLRTLLDSPVGRAVKNALNSMLDITRSGDSIKAGFVKPADGSGVPSDLHAPSSRPR